MEDIWEKDHHHHHHHRHRHRRENPSFSSSLLDAIYRSIDETKASIEEQQEQEVIFYNRDQTVKSKKQNDVAIESDMVKFRRACMIEKWMEKKKVSEKVIIRRNSMADFDRKARNVRDRDCDRDRVKFTNSSSSSSESSCGGGFSSSESESRSSNSYTMQRPKPIKIEKQKPYFSINGNETLISAPNQKAKHENSFVKTKSKALKIYGDLKKVKQPISPGGRLATFLNSLFNGGSPKKHKFTNSDKQNPQQNEAYIMRKSKSAQASTCSSASSFSRSCLSKTNPSSEKLINNNNNNGGIIKRSVRFCPVSVILDEDSRPCGEKSLRDELGLMAVEKTEDLMKNYHQKKNQNQNHDHEEEEEEEEEDDEFDDGISCSSSDLFELENLSTIGVGIGIGIGIGRYSEELPVYETTHFSTNQAIANGLIL